MYGSRRTIREACTLDERDKYFTPLSHQFSLNEYGLYHGHRDYETVPIDRSWF